MGSLGGREAGKKKAMWLAPKVIGASPPGRWGHSACYYNGFVYVFGGCCGGTHFSDVLVLNLEKMTWNILVTSGQGPGPQDSHSAVVVGHKMVVFGGTNGSKKVNDIHILDLQSNEWTVPECNGDPPSPRESHTATLIDDEKLVIFGGSGEGDSNYLNDLHVLDLKTMTWTSPVTRGNAPVPRDSHTAVAIGNRLFLYGGDSGDRYHGDVDVLNLDTWTWSQMELQGPFPGARAGHVSVSLGSKVYVIGGVGEKQYYNDVWILDVLASSWTQLDIFGQKAQGRFSHTANVVNSNIVIYGGCGEDEHPLDELLILQISDELSRGLHSPPLNRFGRSRFGLAKKRLMREADLNVKNGCMKISENIALKTAQELKSLAMPSIDVDADVIHLKRRRRNTDNSMTYGVESDAQDTSLSLSQNSSPSQSDQERPVKRVADLFRDASVSSPPFKETSGQPFTHPYDVHTSGEHSNLPRANRHSPNGYRNGMVCLTEEVKHLDARQPKVLMGSEVHGEVDGAFDSGFLITATVNGMNYRGVLFAPGPSRVPKGIHYGQKQPSFTDHETAYRVNPCLHSQTKFHAPEFRPLQVRRSSAGIRPSTTSVTNLKQRIELQGVDLTLAVPGDGNMGSNMLGKQ